MLTTSLCMREKTSLGYITLKSLFWHFEKLIFLPCPSRFPNVFLWMARIISLTIYMYSHVSRVRPLYHFKGLITVQQEYQVPKLIRGLHACKQVKSQPLTPVRPLWALLEVSLWRFGKRQLLILSNIITTTWMPYRIADLKKKLSACNGWNPVFTLSDSLSMFSNDGLAEWEEWARQMNVNVSVSVSVCASVWVVRHGETGSSPAPAIPQYKHCVEDSI